LARIGIHGHHAVHVLAGIDHQRRTDRLTGEAGTATAGQNRHAMAGCEADCTDHVVLRSWYHHTHWVDLVVTGIGGVEHTADAIKTHLALDARPEFGFECCGRFKIGALWPILV